MIEYPTFVVGPTEFMDKIELFVKELSQPEDNVNELMPTSDPNEISLESPTKRQRILEDEQDNNEQIEEVEPTTRESNIDVNEDSSDEDPEIGEDFIHQLELLQNQDISSLQELIVNMENQV